MGGAVPAVDIRAVNDDVLGGHGKEGLHVVVVHLVLDEVVDHVEAAAAETSAEACVGAVGAVGFTRRGGWVARVRMKFPKKNPPKKLRRLADEKMGVRAGGLGGEKTGCARANLGSSGYSPGDI